MCLLIIHSLVHLLVSYALPTVQAEGPQAAAYQAAAEQLVAGCHAARQFTDTATFTLRCSACMLGLKGAKEAQEHAAATGHTNFTEY